MAREKRKAGRARRKRILIAAYGEAGYARDIVIGANRYSAETGEWYVTYAVKGEWPVQVPWDGVLGCFGWRTKRGQVAEIRRCSRYLVNVGQFLDDVPELPFVGQDNRRIGLQAAEHLLERGFRHYAMLKGADVWATRLRARGFCERLAAEGHKVEVTRAAWRDRHHPGTDAGDLGRWLATLPKPCALFCSSDAVAWQGLVSCQVVGVEVPDEVAILGVDDNEMFTRAVTPALSSVRTNSEKIGYEGAKLLHRMMRGERPPTKPKFIEPESIVTRGSTDVIAIDDPVLKAAVRYMREHACDGINVADILQEVALSRRTLEIKMRKLFGRTPQQELARLRLERAKELLVASDLKLADVARRSGFGSLERFATVFKADTGSRPTVFRQRYRRPAGWDVDVAEAPWRADAQPSG